MGCLGMLVGFPLALVGVLLCFTVIGAIIGVPMGLVGGALFGWGFIKLLKGG